MKRQMLHSELLTKQPTQPAGNRPGSGPFTAYWLEATPQNCKAMTQNHDDSEPLQLTLADLLQTSSHSRHLSTSSGRLLMGPDLYLNQQPSAGGTTQQAPCPALPCPALTPDLASPGVKQPYDDARPYVPVPQHQPEARCVVWTNPIWSSICCYGISTGRRSPCNFQHHRLYPARVCSSTHYVNAAPLG